MDRMRKFGQGVATSLAGLRRRVRLSDELRVRVWSILLWALIVFAASSGLAGWLRSPAREVARGSEASATVGEAWAAAGFGARFVAAYLAAGPGDEEVLTSFLGYRPDLPAADGRGRSGAVTLVGAEPVDDGYWAVTVATVDDTAERFWCVGVVTRQGRLVATGLPTPVAPPSADGQPELAVGVGEAPAPDDAAAQTVVGWVAAYACGQGELSRYMSPRARLDPVSPPLCDVVRVERWGAEEADASSRRVVAEVVLDPDGDARRVTFALRLIRRDGRWEVAELLPAVPLADEPEGGVSS